MDLSSKLVLSVPETATAMGVSRETVRRLIEHEGLPTVVFSSRRLVPVAALQQWLVERTEHSA